MAKHATPTFIPRIRTKRPGIHSKNASKGQTGYKDRYRGQGR